jgi:cation/acetate symporter
VSAALAIFLGFVALVLAISFWLGAKARSAKGYYAAHGEIPWFVNGMAFAGDYLSAASFLGICGMIAMSGYDGFLYSIGYLAGWVVALFVVAEPIKRLGKFTFADALDSRFDSRGIKVAAAISTLVVSVFYLIPQMVGAGAVMQALLGWEHWMGVVTVGAVVTVIVATAGMVSTTWVQFIKGSLLVVLCAVLVALILGRGLSTHPAGAQAKPFKPFVTRPASEVLAEAGPGTVESAAWKDKPYVRVNDANGHVVVWRKQDADLTETQTVVERKGQATLVNGVELPAGHKAAELLRPIGHIAKLPGGVEQTGSLGPADFITAVQGSTIVLWKSEKIVDGDETTTVYYQSPTSGAKLLQPGQSALFKDISSSTVSKLNFISLLLALFAGTASLPHILIRYYTVRDERAARKSTVVGIAAIGFFYVLTLFIGLGAMTSGVLDLTNPKGDMAAPLLARSFGELLFALISAVAFTTILGTVSGLIMAASGAIVHDLMTSWMKVEMDDGRKVLTGKAVAIVVGVVAMALGVAFKQLNPTFLVGWAFSIAASANLPALVMLLFWKGTTKQGIAWAIVVGMISSLGWILLSGDTYKAVYNLDPKTAPMPFSQPGIVTIPLGFLTLIVVSLVTRRKPADSASAAAA